MLRSHDAVAVAEALAFLVEYVPPPLHLVIATCEDPPLALARLRARCQLTEVRAADLRFTFDEAAAFLNQAMGLKLDGDAIAALEARTEGWIAGLQLAARSLQGHSDPASFVAAFRAGSPGCNSPPSRRKATEWFGRSFTPACSRRELMGR